jgi:activator of HSP90 ATPase
MRDIMLACLKKASAHLKSAVANQAAAATGVANGVAAAAATGDGGGGRISGVAANADMARRGDFRRNSPPLLQTLLDRQR